MDTAGYVTLSRQSGLEKEMRAVANNIANISTTGFRREGVLFAEFLRRLPVEGGAIAMTEARAHITDFGQGAAVTTGGMLDLALGAEGFFLIETPDGDRLTRAGNFALSPDGEMISPAGQRVLDIGGGPIFVPPDATDLHIAADGTIAAGGVPLGQIAVVLPEDMTTLSRHDGVSFTFDGGLVPVDTPQILQGALEQSNVSPVAEIARMIEVQRAYEYGARLMDSEDERIRATLRTLGQRA